MNRELVRKLIDKAGNVWLLADSVQPGKTLVVTMTEATMPLNNDGNNVVLIDAAGVGRSRVSYSGSQPCWSVPSSAIQ